MLNDTECSTTSTEKALTWEEYFMSIAHVSAKRSKDPSRHVGCCIIDPLTNKILSIGYNGFPIGCCDTKLPWGKNGDWLETKYPYVVHAEANAVVNSNCSLKGSTAYVTLYPCNECAKLLIQAGVKKIVYETASNTKAEIAASTMFTLSGVTVEKLILTRKFVLETL